MAYNVIVVGAGSAGCVVAARLSEDSGRSVLLLEAGPDYPDAAALPPDLASSLRGTTRSHDWGYASEPDGAGRTIPLPRGRLVGGCSATNATIALRGAPSDYDAWVAGGNPGWSYAEALPFFCHLERDADCADAWHGQYGPIPIQRASHADLTPVQRAFLEACTAAGYPTVPDHNAPGAVGAGPVPRTTHDGVRQSTALTYLAPARPRANLTIRSGVLVDRVVFEGRRAVGIRAVDPAETFYGERIILAAGAYGSPAILLRSGLGPADQLQRLGIGVQAPLAGVGQHLIDHPLYRLRLAAGRVPQTVDGPSWQTVLTWRSTQATVGHDLQILPRSLFQASPAEGPRGAAFLLLAALVKPRSHGQVWLRSASPAVAPCIDPGYFTHPDDLPRLCEAVRLAQRLVQTSPLSDWISRAGSPGLQGLDTDAALAAAIRAEVGTYHHPVGTCRMGPATDASAVVDPHGHVHGVEGLSIIDASIMPTIPAANTNVPTIMVAERCVAWLKEHG